MEKKIKEILEKLMFDLSFVAPECEDVKALKIENALLEAALVGRGYAHTTRISRG
jgi:hypothetical protein